MSEMDRLIRAQLAERRQRPQRGAVTQSHAREPEPESVSFDGGAARRPVMPPRRRPNMTNVLRSELAANRAIRAMYHESD